MKPKKNHHADLEKKRTLHTQVGLVITLAFILIALEWGTLSTGGGDVSFALMGPVIEPDLPELIDVKPREKKKLPQVMTPVPVEESELDPDQLMKDVVFVTPENLGDYPWIIDPVDGNSEEEEQVYEPFEVDMDAKFPGGETAMMSWLSTNLRYPEVPKEHGIGGKVIARFTVSKTGKVTHMVILRGVHPDLDKEVLRLLGRMPDFTPAIRQGRPVAVNMILPVRFTLK